MMKPIDLHAYFQRIGHHGNAAPTLDTLRALHVRHAQTIPFENLNPLLRQPVRLDLESLQQKLIHEGRGGYCYEQNLLFRAVLEELGFPVTGLAARVVWFDPAGTPRTHMLLRVEIHGEAYLADVGFGGMTPTGPLHFTLDTEQPTPHEPFRLRQEADEFVLEAWIADDWKALYRFDLQPQRSDDYEVANWYISTYPSSPFLHNLLASRPLPDGRHTLRNNQYSIHPLNGPTEQRTLADPAELRRLLEGPFGLTLPVMPDLETVLERLTTLGSAP